MKYVPAILKYASAIFEYVLSIFEYAPLFLEYVPVKRVSHYLFSISLPKIWIYLPKVVYMGRKFPYAKKNMSVNMSLILKINCVFLIFVV